MRYGGEHILDVTGQGSGRLSMFFGLVGRLPEAWATGTVWPELRDLGRFTGHFESAASILPRVVWSREFTSATLTISESLGASESYRDENLRLTLSLAVSPRGDAALVLQYSSKQVMPSDAIAFVLAKTCFERTILRVDGRLLMDLVKADLSSTPGIDSLDWGSHVHQCVFADQILFNALSGHQLDQARELPAQVLEIVYRGTLSRTTTQRLGVRTPDALNLVGTAFAAHARGVTLFGGWSQEVQNACQGICLMTIISLGVLRHAKLTAFQALGIDERTAALSAIEARALVADLSRTLDDLLLDLSFGVEAYIDSMLIPELVIESYQRSLTAAVGITEGLANTSRMLDRLSAVITTRFARLEISNQTRDERRERVTSLAIAVASLLALPPALLLAFFGVNSPDVHAHRSIFDMQVYWPAYVVCWTPFILLTVTAVFLRWKIVRPAGLR